MKPALSAVKIGTIIRLSAEIADATTIKANILKIVKYAALVD